MSDIGRDKFYVKNDLSQIPIIELSTTKYLKIKIAMEPKLYGV